MVGKLAALAFLLILVSPLQLSFSQPGNPVTPSVSKSGSYADSGLSALDTGDRITLSLLQTLTNNSLSVSGFERVIQDDLLPYDVRQVLLDVGWQDFTAGNVPFEPWVAYWLQACDLLGVENVFYEGPLTASGAGSPWAESVIRMDPSTKTAFANGTLADYVSPDNPDVAKFIELDLQTMYGYYGSYSSWVGVGTGYPENSPYYSANANAPLLGYSNSSLQQFASSPYFYNLSSLGLNDSGTKDLLSSEFKSTEPSISITSGVWMTSTSYPVYGNLTDSNKIEMRFFVPRNETELLLEWYGSKSGNPAPLTASVHPDDNGSISLNGSVAESNQIASAVSSSPGWQPPLVFYGVFARGYYWLALTSPSSDLANYYSVYIRDYDVGSATASYILPVGQGHISGSSVLWVKDATGQNLSVYPYEQETIPGTTQTFVAESSFSFNTVFLFLSDRDYNPTNATISIFDLSDNDSLVAEGTLSQQLIHGIQNWTPISLDQVVTTIQGNEYSMTITEPNGGYSWAVVMRGLYADPASGGFQNQTSYWLFQLGSMDWAASSTNYGVITAGDPVTESQMLALEVIPSMNEKLNSVQLLMKNLGDTTANYTQGNLTVGIWSSNGTQTWNSASHSYGVQPASPIKSFTVPGSSVPTNSWLNVTGFDQSVTGGMPYWLVLSTTSNSTFYLARLTSSYNSLVLLSSDGGNSWRVPTQGPTDLSYGIFLSNETLGNFIQDIPRIDLNQVTYIAQPFTAASQIQIKGVYLGVLSVQSVLGSEGGLVVSIHPDDGAGAPSQVVLASGSINSGNMTFYSNEYAAFSSVARLQGGERYWIVVQAREGSYTVSPVVYQRPPQGMTQNDSALISENQGFSWQRVSNYTTILSYMAASPLVPIPTYNTTQLSDELSTYYDLPVIQHSAAGWNSYIQSSELSTLNSITAWFANRTGRNWELFDSAYPSIAQRVKDQDVTLLPLADNVTTCGQLQQNFLSTMPLLGEQFLQVGSLSLLASCTSTNLKSLAEELNYMYYLPPSPNSTAGFAQVGANKSLVYSVQGTVGGPLLIWLSNPTTTTIDASISVNETGFSAPRGWDVIDISDLNTQQQNGSIIQTNVSIPPAEWTPLYIEPVRGQLTASYYTSSVLSEFTYPKQGLYYFQAAVNQSVIAAVVSSSPVQTVLLNDQTNLTRLSSAAQILKAPEGWYFDNVSGILFVAYISHGADSIRVLQLSVQAKPAVLPTATIECVIIVLVAVEIGFVLYMAISRRTSKLTSSQTAPVEHDASVPKSQKQRAFTASSRTHLLNWIARAKLLGESFDERYARALEASASLAKRRPKRIGLATNQGSLAPLFLGLVS
jgi:hypothetical protein